MRKQSYLSAQNELGDDIKKMTGLGAMSGDCGVQDVNTLESRTLFERMARHKAISDILKGPDSDDEYEEYQRKKLSQIDQEI